MYVEDKFKIYEFEKDLTDFTTKGLDMLNFVQRKHKEKPEMPFDFYDYAGEYHIKPEYFAIGDDFVYKKKQFAGEIPAEVILGYAYNKVGMYSTIAYPYFISKYNMASAVCLPDGVITKDVIQLFPTAEKRKDDECHTFIGLYKAPNCENITREGKLSKVKETVASIAFNNKDAGYENSFWIRDPKSGDYTGIISIDHGYAGRDSVYGADKDSVMKCLYFKGEHGYNGMYDMEEDRATVLYYLKRLLAGDLIDGVQLTDKEIKDIKALIDEIRKLDFEQIAKDYALRYKYKCSPVYIQSLEWSREDLCKELCL